MADNLAAGPKPKKNEFVRAIIDLFILSLLLVGAGFGGYWYGMHERVAPIEWVPKGTANAIDQSDLPTNSNTGIPKDPVARPVNKTRPEVKTNSTASVRSKRYWLTSQGTDYIGYSITVSVNGDQIDSFFGPGKIVDITSKVKEGDNTIRFVAKQLGEDYNKHAGDTKAELSVKLVSGTKISEDFSSKDVTINYSRNASESTDFQDTKHFKAN